MKRASAVLGTLLFSFLVPAAVGGWIPWLLPHQPFPSPATWWWMGVLPVALGAGLYAWCAVEFARSLGTPLPGADTETLVVHGPYRHVRNPMYSAVLATIAGWAIALRSPAIAVYGLAVGLAMHAFTVLVEEPRLRRRFGASYDEYLARVGRWFPRRPASDDRFS
jgi:protein-S-isoprenylcysteine O-methyltransferase Ste14